jgi:hypothetical protein
VRLFDDDKEGTGKNSDDLPTQSGIPAGRLNVSAFLESGYVRTGAPSVTAALAREKIEKN